MVSAGGWLLGGLAVGLFVAGAVGSSGCRKASSNAEPQASTTSQPQEPVAAATSLLDEPSFHLEMRPAGTYQKGTAATVEVVLEAKPPYKVNGQYPIKLQLEPAKGVKFDADTVGKDRVALQGGKQAVMKVGFTPESSGRKRIAGKLKFSVCNDERCLMETRELELSVDVR